MAVKIKKHTPGKGNREALDKVITRIKRTARKYNVKFSLVNARFVSTGGVKSNGYFDDSIPELAVAIDQPREHWMPVLLHESSHMDQWIEQIPEWTVKHNDIDAMSLIDLWLHKKIELSPSQLNLFITQARDVELDCEKRTVDKIRRYKLMSININEYIQKANAYVYFYNYVKVKRKWYSIGNEPYNIEAIWSKMPTSFNNDYTKLPQKIKNLFEKYL